METPISFLGWDPSGFDTPFSDTARCVCGTQTGPDTREGTREPQRSLRGDEAVRQKDGTHLGRPPGRFSQG
jgi:hypothetical protein